MQVRCCLVLDAATRFSELDAVEDARLREGDVVVAEEVALLVKEKDVERVEVASADDAVIVAIVELAADPFPPDELTKGVDVAVLVPASAEEPSENGAVEEAEVSDISEEVAVVVAAEEITEVLDVALLDVAEDCPEERALDASENAGVDVAASVDVTFDRASVDVEVVVA